MEVPEEARMAGKDQLDGELTLLQRIEAVLRREGKKRGRKRKLTEAEAYENKLRASREYASARRKVETEEQRQRRLQDCRERVRARRANEREEERKRRQEEMKLRVRLKRENETEEERQLRKEAVRLHMQARRGQETEEMRQRRLEINREKMRLRRENETKEQRESRLRANRERLKALRQGETEQEHEARMEKDARQKKNKGKQAASTLLYLERGLTTVEDSSSLASATEVSNRLCGHREFPPFDVKPTALSATEESILEPEITLVEMKCEPEMAMERGLATVKDSSSLASVLEVSDGLRGHREFPQFDVKPIALSAKEKSILEPEITLVEMKNESELRYSSIKSTYEK